MFLLDVKQVNAPAEKITFKIISNMINLFKKTFYRKLYLQKQREKYFSKHFNTQTNNKIIKFILQTLFIFVQVKYKKQGGLKIVSKFIPGFLIFIYYLQLKIITFCFFLGF